MYFQHQTKVKDISIPNVCKLSPVEKKLPSFDEWYQYFSGKWMGPEIPKICEGDVVQSTQIIQSFLWNFSLLLY